MKEEWKPIPKYEGIYEVSNLGSIRSVGGIMRWIRKGKLVNVLKQKRLLKNKIVPNGYLHVNLTKYPKQSATFYVHRLVASVFVPNPLDKRCVNHIDSDRTNNKYANLEWVTHKENTHHAIKKGRIHPPRHYSKLPKYPDHPERSDDVLT